MHSGSAAPRQLAVSDNELARRFTYQPPRNDEEKARYATITEVIFRAAQQIRDLTPGGREQSLAMTCLQEARMWANAAVATGER